MPWLFKKAKHSKSPWISEWISEIPSVGLDLDSGRLYLISQDGNDFWGGCEPLRDSGSSQSCLLVYCRVHGFILVMPCWGSVTNNHILGAAPFQAAAKRETWSVLLVSGSVMSWRMYEPLLLLSASAKQRASKYIFRFSSSLFFSVL